MSDGSRFWTDDLWVAALLSAAAGFADAVGYVKSGVFAANMTGNTVLAGLSLAAGKWDVAAQRGMTLAAFCVGVAVASLSLASREGVRPSRSSGKPSWCSLLRLPRRGSTSRLR